MKITKILFPLLLLSMQVQARIVMLTNSLPHRLDLSICYGDAKVPVSINSGNSYDLELGDVQAVFFTPCLYNKQSYLMMYFGRKKVFLNYNVQALKFCHLQDGVRFALLIADPGFPHGLKLADFELTGFAPNQKVT